METWERKREFRKFVRYSNCITPNFDSIVESTDGRFVCEISVGTWSGASMWGVRVVEVGIGARPDLNQCMKTRDHAVRYAHNPTNK